MPKQREKMTEVHSCGSPPFSTCLGAVASFIISQGQKCHKKPFPLVYYQSHKEKSVKGGHRPQRLPLILFFVGYNAGGENGCPSVSLLPPVLYCPLTLKQIFQAKVWASFLLSMLVSVISFAAMFLVIETELFFLAGRLLIPSVSWLVVILLLSPAISLIAITLIVRGSAKAQSVEESQQAAVFLILPVILPIAGQFTGVFLMNVWILLGLGVICAILAWFLLQKSMGRFTYEKLLQ